MVVAKKHHELYSELASIVGAKYVSDELGVLLTYTRDISLFPPAKPQGVVVRPESTEQVVQIVRLANETKTPIVPMGGKASISGVPPGQPGRGIIVDMKRMDKIIEINEENMAVTAQAGITLGELSGRLKALGYNIQTAGVPHYMDTIGGHISGEPGAGFGHYSYSIGWNWHYILGVKVVLPNGKVVDTGTGEGTLAPYRGNTWARGAHGPDLAGMFIGDAGVYGIKVEATYRFFRVPKFKKTSARSWDTLEDAYKCFHELWDIDPFIYMQPYAASAILSPEMVKAFTFGLGEQKWVIFFVCVGNSQEEVDLKLKKTDEVCAKHGGKTSEQAMLGLAENFTDMTQEMSVFATLGQAPMLELIVPRSEILECYKWAREHVLTALEKRGIDSKNIPFLSILLPTGTGYGMITVNVIADESNLKLAKDIYEIQVEFLEQGMRRGYVLEATQGHEARLKARQWTPEFFDFASTLKKALDPNNIMNPGLYFY
jgi:glycolate oxidase